MPIIVIALAALVVILILLWRALVRYEPQHSGGRRTNDSAAGPGPEVRPGRNPGQLRAASIVLERTPPAAAGPPADWQPRIAAGRQAQLAPVLDAAALAIITGIGEAISREYATLWAWSAHMQRAALWMP